MPLTASSDVEGRILLDSRVGDAVFGFYVLTSVLFALGLAFTPLDGLLLAWSGTAIIFCIGVSGFVWRQHRYALGMVLTLLLYPISISATWNNGLYFLAVLPVLSIPPILLLSNKVGLALSSGFLLLFLIPVYLLPEYDEDLLIRLLIENVILIVGIYLFVRFTKERLEKIRKQTIDLEAANAALEVGRRKLTIANKELVAQQEKLDEQAQRQAQMYAVIAHELRTPAAILKMILDRKSNDGVDYTLVSGLSDQLLEVLDSLRSVARPEEMLLASTRPVQLGELLHNQVEMMRVIAADQGVELTADLSKLEETHVFTQSQLVQQALRNLINNAILHSGGDHVAIVARDRRAGQNAREIEIVVDDNGSGIEPEQADRLFDAFERGDTRADGTGLGLSITQEISRKLGGSLRYQANPKGGSRFVLDFVAKVDGRSKIHSIHQDNSGGEVLTNKRVLVVDDNLTIRVLAQSMLEQLGANVIVASNGREALEALDYKDADLIMTDIFMPELDGFTFVEMLRANGCTAKIIGMTASAVTDELDRMISSGADGVICKPFDVDDLRAALAKVFDDPDFEFERPAATG